MLGHFYLNKTETCKMPKSKKNRTKVGNLTKISKKQSFLQKMVTYDDSVKNLTPYSKCSLLFF